VIRRTCANSGNFTHAIIGEGGHITTKFARVIGYTTKAALLHGDGTARRCDTSLGGITSDSGRNERGTSASRRRSTSATSSATPASTSIPSRRTSTAVRTWCAPTRYYFLDEGMKLKGTAPAPLGAFGMDMNYNHKFLAGDPGTPTFPPGTGNPNDRIAFSARPDGNIDVWDTFFYGQIGTIVVRDPSSGHCGSPGTEPIHGSGCFGVTTAGLVMIELR